MAWNIVKIENLLLGNSLTTKKEAEGWKDTYAKKYPGVQFTVVETTVEQTCDIPPAGAYRAFGSQK